MTTEEIQILDDEAESNEKKCDVIEKKEESTRFELRHRVRDESDTKHRGRTAAQRRSKKGSKPLPGYDAFVECLRLAEYEVNNDPYRGIFSSEPSPWQQSCAIGPDKTNVDSRREAEDLVLKSCHCQCPSMISWTASNLTKRKTPKVLIGKRPDDVNMVCRCDSNPFCIASLGGVVNEIIASSSQTVASDDDVIMLDANEDRYDPEHDECIYSEATRTKLRAVRKECVVETKTTIRHLKRALQDLVGVLPISDALKRIRLNHRQLAFVNPLIAEKTATRESLQLSMPPGIENLGATCYLNTQLQCLAQNLVFLEGILSWVPPTDDSGQMTKVLIEFQRLLANMSAGPRCVLNTTSFSNGLGLDTYEQQDPNEFSRLFLDKIHQTFSTCDQPDLVSLLPHLFQGKTRYTTTCSSCKSRSQRTEDFMDLTLPIIRRPREAGQRTIKESLKKAGSDTDVQFCIDRYIEVEKLDGDNQYYCDSCGKKVDAERATSFSNLPKVLNIQLCRYVYDRKKGVKTKIQDKVLLPTSIKLSEIDAEDVLDKRFVLCAVMVHKGKSAYSGHYVAEAMNWETGLWFEFNDTHVKHMESASCSYEPADGKPPSGTGSSDAYNLYYLDEMFLAQTILENLKREAPVSVPQNVEEVVLEKANYFQDLMQKEFIRTKFLPNLSACRLPASETSSDLFWVDGLWLRRFLSCDRSLNVDSTDLRSTYLQHFSASNHTKGSGLHPRVVRRGKLLSNSAFHCLLDCLEDESQSLKNGPCKCNDWSSISIQAKDVFSETLSNTYRIEIAEKLRLCKKLLFLHQSLDPTGEAALKTEDAEQFVVARKFITSFRNRIAQIMKTFVNFEKGVTPGVLVTDKILSVVEGVDAVDVRNLVSSDDPKNSNQMDTFINGSIACEHGVLSCLASSRQRCKVVNIQVWNTLKELFPDAIEIKVPAAATPETFAPVCPDCRMKEEQSYHLRYHLHDLAIFFKKDVERLSIELNELLDSETGSATRQEVSLYRVIHEKDLASWTKFVNTFSRKDDKLLDARAKVKQIFSPLEIGGSSAEADSSSRGWCLRTLHPIVCRQHRLPLHHALFEAGEPMRLSPGLVLMKEEKYSLYMSALFAVSRFILGVYDNEQGEIPATKDLLHEIQKEIKMLDWHLQLSFGKNTSTNCSFRLYETDAQDGCCVLSNCCVDELCSENFRNWNGPKVDTTILDTAIGTGNATGGASDPICLDGSEPETLWSLCLRVFHVKPSADISHTIDSLLQCLQLPQRNSVESYFRRSNRRRKTVYPNGAILSEDVVFIEPKHNIASVRLQLMQQCEHDSFKLNHELSLVDVVLLDSLEDESARLDVHDPKIHRIEFSSNEKSVSKVCSSCFECTADEIHQRWEKSKTVVLLRKSVEDSTMTQDALLDYLISISNAIDSKETRGKRKREVEKGFTGTLLSTTATGSTDGDAKDPEVDSPPGKVTKVDNGTIHRRTSATSESEAQCLVIESADENPSSQKADKQDASERSGLEEVDSRPVTREMVLREKDCMSTSKMELIMEVAKVLRSRADTCMNEEKCLEAAKWVVENDHCNSSPLPEMIEYANAKYFELTE